MPSLRTASVLDETEYDKHWATVATYVREVVVLGGHFGGKTTIRIKDGSNKVFLSYSETTNAGAKCWIEDMLPHLVPDETRRSVADRSDDRRWLQENTTGLFAIMPIKDGVRFASEADAFWYKLART